MAAFDLPFPPFPHDVREVPYITSPDDNNGHTVPSSQYFKKLVGDKYLWTPVSSTDPLPVVDAAAQATLTAIQGYVDGLEAVLGTAIASPTAYTVVARLKDLATALGEVGASPAANTVLARIKTLEGYLDGVEAALGTTADAEATGNGSVIAIVKQLRKLVTDAYATFGSAAPTKGLMMAGTDGTNARAIKTNENGEVLTQLSGSITSVSSPPVVGTKTITATAAEIFAGASVKANRRKLIIRNEDPVLRMRIGPSSVTQQNGYPIEPGATVEIQFDPATAVSVYGISEGAALNIAVMEV